MIDFFEVKSFVHAFIRLGYTQVIEPAFNDSRCALKTAIFD